MSTCQPGIEWEDDMVDVNRMTNPTNMRWKLIDRQTGAEGAAIDWRFRVGQRVKIRLVNEMDSDHPDAPPVSRPRGRAFSDSVARRQSRKATLSGRTRSSCTPAKPLTFSWTSRTPACGWRIAISPSITRAA